MGDHLRVDGEYLIEALSYQSSAFNPFQASVAFHIETSHLFCRAKQITGFHVKRNTGLKWLNKFIRGSSITIFTVKNSRKRGGYFLTFWPWVLIYFQAGIYLFRINNGNTIPICEIFLKLTIKTSEQRYWRRSCHSDVLLLILNRFYALLSCFFCWLWKSDRHLGKQRRIFQISM